MNIDKWLQKNDSQRYEQTELKRKQWEAEQRRQQNELKVKWAEENDCPMGLTDNDGW